MSRDEWLKKGNLPPCEWREEGQRTWYSYDWSIGLTWYKPKHYALMVDMLERLNNGEVLIVTERQDHTGRRQYMRKVGSKKRGGKNSGYALPQG